MLKVHKDSPKINTPKNKLTRATYKQPQVHMEQLSQSKEVGPPLKHFRKQESFNAS